MTIDKCFVKYQPTTLQEQVCGKPCKGYEKLCIGYFSNESVKRIKGENYIKQLLKRKYYRL